MASKIDKVIDRLERLTNDVNDIKAKGIGLLPVPKPVKGALRAVSPTFDQVLTDTYFDGVRAIADVVLPADVAREVINNPNVLMDANGSISQITAKPAAAKPRKVTKKMKQQRKIQSTAFRNANAKGRLQNGSFRAGFDQSRIARMAQKECTAERIRLGLCDDPKKKMKKKKK